MSPSSSSWHSFFYQMKDPFKSQICVFIHVALTVLVKNFVLSSFRKQSLSCNHYCIILVFLTFKKKSVIKYILHSSLLVSVASICTGKWSQDSSNWSYLLIEFIKISPLVRTKFIQDDMVVLKLIH